YLYLTRGYHSLHKLPYFANAFFGLTIQSRLNPLQYCTKRDKTDKVKSRYNTGSNDFVFYVFHVIDPAFSNLHSTFLRSPAKVDT
ncbi:MAG: hypothetical protein ACP5JP_10925, partial [bacterium]